MTRAAPSRSPETVQSRWVRVSVINTGRSHLANAEAFLVGVHIDRDGNWSETPFIDPLRLAWSATSGDAAYRVRDLTRGVQFFVDVCHSAQGAWGGSDTFDVVAADAPQRFGDHLTRHPGRYRLTIIVTGEAVKPVERCVFVTWNGHWDALLAASS
jgi:hypothetical protein